MYSSSNTPQSQQSTLPPIDGGGAPSSRTTSTTGPVIAMPQQPQQQPEQHHRVYSSLSHVATATNEFDDDDEYYLPRSLSSSSSPDATLHENPTTFEQQQQQQQQQPPPLTNFMKYGSIRPPVSVLQEEFLDKYRSWRVHVEPLRGMDRWWASTGGAVSAGAAGSAGNAGNATSGSGRGNSRGESSQSSSAAAAAAASAANSGGGAGGDDIWTSHMATVQKMHAQHYQPRNPAPRLQSRSGQPNYYEGGWIASTENDTVGAPTAITTTEELRTYDDEEKAYASAYDDDDYALPVTMSAETTTTTTSTSATVDEERTKLEKLAALLFRPGSKLSGTLEVRPSSSSSLASPRGEYDLVVMEGDAPDELGRSERGMLARHKFGGDEQCVFVKTSFVPVPPPPVEALEDVIEEGEEEEEEEEEKESIKEEEEEEAPSKEHASSADVKEGGNRNESADSKHPSSSSENHKLTIQMDYVDGDHLVTGLWNHDKLCFEGTLRKMNEGEGEQTQLGGTIVSGLISGHSSSFNDGDDTNGPSASDSRRSSRSQLTSTHADASNLGPRAFSISPCTHLHPRGVAPLPPPWQALLESLSRMGLTSAQPPETSSTGGGGMLLRRGSKGKESENPTATASFPPSSKETKVVLTPAQRKKLLDELASLDNYKLVLHRARTETLRRETLTKLVELGGLIDFAELARKRNVAKRREKWRGRVRKYTPRVLSRRLLQRRSRGSRTSATTSAATAGHVSGRGVAVGEDYDAVQKKKVQFYDQLAVISWGDLLEEASIQAERTCAVFRRQTSLLDGLTFESDEYKAQIMVDLRTNGLTLASSHTEWDKCIQMGRTVALGWSWFERGSWSCFERSAVVGKRCVYLLFQMHSRLESNHKHLEKAYRSADARLTNVELMRIKNGFASQSCAQAAFNKKIEGGKEGNDGLCGICQCNMDDDDNGEESKNQEDEDVDNPAVCLPCGHSFHWNCIREWLHNHSQCPICRVDLHSS